MKLEGLEGLQAALGKMTKEIEAEVDKAVDATGLELRGEVVKAYQRGPKTGRVYTHYFFTDGSGNLRRGRERDKPHQASKEGEAPATDSGRLASSVNYKKDGAMSATVGSEIVYAAMLEFGTSRIAPRPAWVPAVEAMRSKFERRIQDALARATR